MRMCALGTCGNCVPCLRTKLVDAEKRATEADESAKGMRAYWQDVVELVHQIAPHHSNTHGGARQILKDYAAMQKRLADAENRDKLWRQYRDLLGEEIDGMIGIAHAHGWAFTPERIKRGEELRKALGIEARDT